MRIRGEGMVTPCGLIASKVVRDGREVHFMAPVMRQHETPEHPDVTPQRAGRTPTRAPIFRIPFCTLWRFAKLGCRPPERLEPPES
jgi:hypothetical protein